MRVQSLITSRSYFGSYWFRPMATNPGIANPTRDPHWAPNPITAVAVAVSFSLNHERTTILSPLNTMVDAKEKQVLDRNRMKYCDPLVNASSLHHPVISIKMAANLKTLTAFMLLNIQETMMLNGA